MKPVKQCTFSASLPLAWVHAALIAILAMQMVMTLPTIG